MRPIIRRHKSILQKFVDGDLSADYWFFPILGISLESIHGYQYTSIFDEEREDTFGKITICVKEPDKCTSVFLENHELFSEKYQDWFAKEFWFFVFRVPDEWKFDFERILSGKPVSKDYKKRIRQTFPNGISYLQEQQMSMYSNQEVNYGRQRKKHSDGNSASVSRASENGAQREHLPGEVSESERGGAGHRVYAEARISSRTGWDEKTIESTKSPEL